MWLSGSPSFLQCLVLSSIFVIRVAQSELLDKEFEQCKNNETFSKTTFVCDPKHLLQRTVTKQLEALLRGIQDKVECNCEDGCARGGGLSDKYIVLVFVANSSGLNTSLPEGVESLNATLKRLYGDFKLGTEHCDHGLAIIYIKTEKKLVTYRGKDRFMLLDEKDMAKFHQISTKGWNLSPLDEPKSAADQLESGSKEIQLGFPESWIPFIGLIVVLLLILVILCLFFCILAKLCRRRPKETYPSKYYINPAALAHHKSLEPIYIPTPVPSLRGTPYRVHPSEYCYGPPLMTPTMPIHPSPYTYQPRSRSVTPTSTHRVRRSGAVSASATPDHLASTPASRKRANEASRGGGHPSSSHVDFVAAEYDITTDGGTSSSRQPRAKSVPPSSDLSFLDPKRRLETQTKEEFIA